MKKKSIIICTWHYFQNIGSQLQAVALFNCIKNLGLNVKVLNYRNKKYCKSHFDETIKVIHPVFSLLCFLLKKRRAGLFNRFCYTNLDLTRLFYGKESISFKTKPDILVFGSDQIWAQNVFDEVYFGSISCLSNDIKRFSYAPSVVTNQVYTKEQAFIIKEHLSLFSSVSFREPISSDISTCFGLKKYEVVCDPSLLMSKTFYEGLSNKKIVKKIKNKNYCLSYFLTQTEKTDHACSSLKEKYGYRIVNISKQSIECADLNLYSKTGPAEFLALVSDSDFILTDSFHGVCFSLIYRKNFFVIERFHSNDDLNQNRRISFLLDIFGLSDRILPFGLENFNDIENVNIDFDRAWKRANWFINKSKKFLEKEIGYDEKCS
ncbi:MAG: polysaccharide pyruvyl transferase family protein [Erysipelotrichaceae bacterium]|nr:polysaccharide pyruvyl transferase family protein [Erysipelotrichaceae bacterium]